MLLKLCFKSNYGWILGPLYLIGVLMKPQQPKQPQLKFRIGKKNGRVKNCPFFSVFWNILKRLFAIYNNNIFFS